ncbi:MAG: citrate/2-methylcitrate synthase [Oscillospiraceae bacterium]|nr:citrate/2-methylcitrate synthase [Oscillospiraceae bacterium]
MYNITIEQVISKLEEKAKDVYTTLPNDIFRKYNVKKGLRNEDGTGVVAGITSIGEVAGYYIEDGEKMPMEGHLRYRGIDIYDLVKNCREKDRFGFEEVVYLLLFGNLPTQSELEGLKFFMEKKRALPKGFMEDMIMRAPSVNVMNKLARSVLALYSYDINPDDLSLGNILRQSLGLVSMMPVITAYAYQAKRHYHDHESLYIHSPLSALSTAENFLHMIRKDNKFTHEEALMLDTMLMLHAEHGGGNNSAFTVRVVSSSDTDTYSAMAAAIGSLKGPKHGGANAKVMGMMDNIKQNVADWKNEDEVASYIEKIIKKEAFDNSGLIYGMGHAIYTKSDPRAVLLKEQAEKLIEKKTEYSDEFELYKLVEDLTPEVFARVKNNSKVMCANVDLYSGFVYKMLNISPDLYTPLFAISRIVGWSAHRIEEVLVNKRIMRPAYKSISKSMEYVNIEDREMPD